MKIGVFDSGLGGLWVLKNIREMLPLYDYVFFADQAYVPYGNKTKEELFDRATKIFKHLYEIENCKIIVIACNTNSTSIFEELKLWVKENYPDRLIVGIVLPTILNIKSLIENNNIKDVVFFGTHRTVNSHVYKTELENLDTINTSEIEMSLLASLIEEGKPTLEYIKSFSELDKNKEYIGALVCTHYGIVREDFKKVFPSVKHWVYQEDILPNYLKSYLNENSNLTEVLSKDNSMKVIVSKESPVFNDFLYKWFGGDFKFSVCVW